MEKKPLISVIIPTYNGSQNIGRALRSVLNQTYSNFEILVVDDASTDNTVDVVNSIKDKRIFLIRHKKNKNGSAARNTGIRASKGEYIALLDDDDEWFPSKLEKQIQYIQKKGDKSFKGVVTWCFISNGFKDRYVKISNEGDFTMDLLLMKVSLGVGSSFLFSREVVDKIGLFDEKYLRHQDIEFILRYMREFKLGVVKEYLYRKYGFSGTPSGENLLSVKKVFLKDFKNDIERFDKRVQRRIYARHWLQVSKHFAFDGDIHNCTKYLLKSLCFSLLNSNSLFFLPNENYVTIPYYLLRSIAFGKKIKKMRK